MLEIPGDGEVSDDENVAHEEDGQLIEERTHSSDPEDSSDSDYENNVALSTSSGRGRGRSRIRRGGERGEGVEVCYVRKVTMLSWKSVSGILYKLFSVPIVSLSVMVEIIIF